MKKMVFFLLSVVFCFSAKAAPGDGLKYLPVQDGGRVKPYDSFAREMLEIVYGKTKFEKRNATEIVMTWMLAPQSWEGKKIFEVRNHQVLEALKLPKEQRYFTGAEIFGNERFTLLRQELQNKRESKEKLNPYFQALQRLENQFFTFQEIAAGRMLKLVPPVEGDAWISVSEMQPEQQEVFMEVTKAFVSHIGAMASEQSTAQTGADLDAALVKFQESAKKQNPVLYDHASKIRAEVHYNEFHPFRWSYILYFIAFTLLLLVWTLNKPGLSKAAWVFLIAGFILHTYGFGLRMYIMGRAPVSNMYETVIWVSWGTILFAAILELIYKFRVFLVAGTLVAAFGLVIADFAPAVLDPTLQPLEPVLRSNYWLTIHVMTITISYAAFFLAFGLGDLGLFYYLRGEEKYQHQIRSVVTGIYRSIQIGVAFLAPGIILGGIWADYSWGRFWGWDPKETWALIALLGYLAVLHARYAGMIKNFGMVVTGIITFSLVIMAWYGVNFVLGAGLHSYGFGAGGIEYVSAFVGLHILAVIYVAILRRGRNSSDKKSA
ncbi:cytochrome C biogenesis protein [Bdellovibrio bacteriovorus]|uniref:Cytochrome C biogenesis protein n=1 Tax=Bdellovibrio bacteriovorus TaxID=959 RepID=A0A150WM87_BDEBC|nr:cytochrome C biogenesis protein [Bdellovibrio bacteriovorus]